MALDRPPTTAGDGASRDGSVSACRPLLAPGPFEEPRLWQRPVRSQCPAVLDGHPAKYAERVTVAKCLANIFSVAITEALIGQSPNGAVGPTAIHTVADRHEPLSVEGADGAGEEGHVLPQDCAATPLHKPRMVRGRPAACFGYLEISAIFLVPVADLPHRKLKTSEHRTRRHVPVHTAQRNQMSGVFVG